MVPPDVSRRTLLANIGAAAIGSALLGDTKRSSLLPPGVYDPSSDHLGHALMSSGRFHPIPAGCPTDYVRPATEPFTPLFFSRAEFEVIRRLAELMLSEAPPAHEAAEWIDLSVASAAGVRDAARHQDPLCRSLAISYFGPARVAQLETDDPAKICHEGLAWLAAAASSRGSDQFLSLPEEQQIGILESISDERPDKQTENAGTQFFLFLKAELIRAFYTSQPGLKELDFKGNAFYARSPGCTQRTSALL